MGRTDSRSARRAEVAGQPLLAEIAARFVAAVAVLIGGLVHIELYFRKGYRSMPNANLGRSFMLNGIASIVVAAVLLVRRDLLVRLAGVAVTVGTLIAFYLSRNTDNGIFGFREKGFSPSPEAAIALIVEIVALVVLAVSFVPALRWRRQTAGPTPVAYAGAAGVVLVGVIATLVWVNG